MKNKKTTSFADTVFNAIEQFIASLFDRVLPRGGFSVFPPGEISNKFKDIESMETKIAIIEADKLVDNILKKGGIKGSTLGERLRNTEKLVPREVYSNMWEAHKVRNMIVHDDDFDIKKVDRDLVIWRMKKFLMSLGVFKNER